MRSPGFRRGIIFCMIFFITQLAAFSQELTARQLIEAGDKLVLDKRYKEALMQYEKALKINSDEPESNYKIGVANYFLNNYAEAINAYKVAIKLNPEYFKALNNLGLIYEKLENYGEAEQYYKEAVKINPQYKTARYNLGAVLFKQNKNAEAEKVGRELIDLNPEYDMGYYLLGLILEENEKYEDAAKMFEKAVSISSSNTGAAEGIKRIKIKLEISDKQRKDLETARRVIRFKVPAGFEFKNLVELQTGAKVIQAVYKESQEIFIIKFPDSYSLKDKNIKDVITEFPSELVNAFEELKITNLSVIADKELAEEKGADLNFKNRYAEIKCRISGADMNGMMALVPAGADDPAAVFLSAAPAGSFSFSAAGKFLSGISAQ